MTFEPIGERLLIRQKVTQEQRLPSGIVLATEGPKKFPLGTVIALGNGEKVKMFAIGDEIYFDEWGGVTLDKELSGEDNLVIIAVEKVIAKLCQKS